MPRDLFNEANLLKCYGQLWLGLEKLSLPRVDMIHIRERDGYEIGQDASDGSIYVINVKLSVRGRWVHLYRSLNSREPFPLYAQSMGVEYEVFNPDGTLHAEFVAFLERKRNGTHKE